MNLENFIEETNKLGINITKTQLDQLLKFYSLLIEWNQKMNLTRITELEEVYLKHFYDSLTIVKVVDLNQIESLCDVGSGAGFPGIVLKIIYPHLQITLIDSLQKRVNYLNSIIENLELSNIEAIHTRAEDYARDNREKYDLVTARAVANLKLLSELCLPMVKENRFFIAMKANAREEITAAKDIIKKLNGKITVIEEFNLPIENSIRTLIKIVKTNPTSHQYPRKKLK